MNFSYTSEGQVNSIFWLAKMVWNGQKGSFSLHIDINLLHPSGPLLSSRSQKSPGNTVKTHFLIFSTFFTCKLSIGCSWCHSFENTRNRCIVSAISLSAVALFLPPSFGAMVLFPLWKMVKKWLFLDISETTQKVSWMSQKGLILSKMDPLIVNWVSFAELTCPLMVLKVLFHQENTVKMVKNWLFWNIIKIIQKHFLMVQNGHIISKNGPLGSHWDFWRFSWEK